MSAQQQIDLNKNILIFGKSEVDRHIYLNKILLQLNFEIIKFPKRMTDISQYIDTIRKKSLYTPFYESKKRFNSNQLLDFHRDWIAENKCYLILEEFQQMEESWKLEILRILLENCEINKNSASLFIITLDEEDKILSKLFEIITPNQYKTSKQIVASNLEIIEI